MLDMLRAFREFEFMMVIPSLLLGTMTLGSDRFFILVSQQIHRPILVMR